MITEQENRLMKVFASNPSKWFTHREICEKLEADYNDNKLRDPLKRLQAAEIIKQKISTTDKSDSNKSVKQWTAKDL